MNLRRILGTSVVLACVLAVYASPIAEPDDEGFDVIEARNYDDFDLALQLRELAASYGVPRAYDFNIHERRAPQKQKAAPKKKPAAKAPARKPAVKKPAAKKPAAKKPAPKKPATRKPAPKKPNAKKPSPKKPASKRPGTKKPSPKKPGNRPTKPGTKPANQKPPANGASCPIRGKGGKGKRAFDTSCGKAELTLGGVKRGITQVGQQGNSAITYKVDGGWPDPSTGKDVTAYAKTGKTPAETFASEIKWLGKTDQLLAEGKYEGRQFIVFHGVTGKVDITGTAYWKSLAEKFMMKGDIAGCEAEVKKSLIPLIIREAKVYVEKFQVLHTDIQPGNILWDAAGTDPTLIDWGRANEVAQWSADVEKQVRAQAEFSHLKGDEKICHNFAG